VGRFGGHGEIRQLEDRYGISPAARRRLQWEIKQGEAVDHPTRRSRQRNLRAIEATL
jgi:hypothetical protein